MMLYYLINTLVAMTIGLALSNLIKPGHGADLADMADPPRRRPPEEETSRAPFVEMIPEKHRRRLRQEQPGAARLADPGPRHRPGQDPRRAAGAGRDRLTRWSSTCHGRLRAADAGPALGRGAGPARGLRRRGGERRARTGFRIFQSLVWFIVVVLAGLACQVTWYLTQIAIFARMSPLRFLRGAADVMATSFSTASTAATMPITLRALTGPLGVSRQSSQLAACVGTNFNNDGTALYQAAVVLFMAQALGCNLSLIDQIVVVLTTVVASIGAGGIPSGGFVTLPLIFAAVGLPAEKIPFLLTIDWFLDRCRTTSNVLGDMTVAVLLDRTAGKPNQPRPSVSHGTASAETLGHRQRSSSRTLRRWPAESDAGEVARSGSA